MWRITFILTKKAKYTIENTKYNPREYKINEMLFLINDSKNVAYSLAEAFTTFCDIWSSFYKCITKSTSIFRKFQIADLIVLLFLFGISAVPHSWSRHNRKSYLHRKGDCLSLGHKLTTSRIALTARAYVKKTMNKKHFGQKIYHNTYGKPSNCFLCNAWLPHRGKSIYLFPIN